MLEKVTQKRLTLLSSSTIKTIATTGWYSKFKHQNFIFFFYVNLCYKNKNVVESLFIYFSIFFLSYLRSAVKLCD